MSQHDYNIADALFPAFRTDLNNALLAAQSNNSGATEPASMAAYQWWVDTTTGLLKQRNAANSAWVTMATLATGAAAAVAVPSASKIYLDGIAGTGDTYIFESSANVLDLFAGGVNTLRLSATAAIITGAVLIGDTSNPNNTKGLTINQGTAVDAILTFKGGNGIAHGITTINKDSDVETDDFAIFGTIQSSTGGLYMTALQGAHDVAFHLETWQQTAPQVTDTSASEGAMNFFGGLHNGSNADLDFAANSNLVCWGEIDTSNARLTRMLLKADDGELHLGNTTLVALDDEEDALIIRAMQKTSSIQGIIESQWDNPFYDYDKLHQLGLAGEKDASGFFLFPLQPRLAAHEGAIWQTHCRTKELEAQVSQLLTRLNQLEYRNA